MANNKQQKTAAFSGYFHCGTCPRAARNKISFLGGQTETAAQINEKLSY
jgi:hypothetical protein